jgi:hypothetical protein
LARIEARCQQSGAALWGATELRFLTFFYAVLSGQLGARRRIAKDPLRSFECHQ